MEDVSINIKNINILYGVHRNQEIKINLTLQ
jgi:hypothetical protein